jgi:hypothetical protein
VTGHEVVRALDGAPFDCWVVEAAGAEYTFRSFVSKEPPYLTMQLTIPEEGDPITPAILKSKPFLP